MSDIGATDASHTNRLRFEQIATLLAAGTIALLLIACFIGLYPTAWTEQVIQRAVQIKDTVIELLGTLGGFLGMSWGRGHMDKRIE